MELLRITQAIRLCTCATIAMVFLSLVLQTQAHMWRRQAEAGTTMNIEEIFTGRCYEHLQCLQSDQCTLRPPEIDCKQLWNLFLGVWQFVDPCNTSGDAYDEVLAMAVPKTPKDQTLFWSGLLDAALNVARVSEHYRILEETLPGYIANKLIWCGDPGSASGINYAMCPTSYDCDNETSFTYWRAASREFSRQATGDVSVALNAHRDGGAFRNTSVFATVELPNLDPDKVNTVQIMLVPDITKPVEEAEMCGEGSILVLQSLIEERGMEWTCMFDPLEFRYIQCTTLDNPLDYPACRGGSKESYKLAIIIGAVLGTVILFLIVILILIIIKICRSLRTSPYEDGKYLTEEQTPNVL